MRWWLGLLWTSEWVIVVERQCSNFYTPIFKTGRIMVYQCPTVRPSISHSNIRTPWPIHFKFHRVIEIDGLMVCILFGEISIFHSRVMGLYSSNCRRFFVCRAVNWEPLRQFTSNFVLLLELIVSIDFSKNVVFNCINVPIHVYGATVGEI